MDSFKITNFGLINSVDIQLGDLTILLGPQASGKTLFLQMLKLLIDKDHIVQTLARYNYVTNKQPDQILTSPVSSYFTMSAPESMILSLLSLMTMFPNSILTRCLPKRDLTT